MKNTIEKANTDYQLGKFDTMAEALEYHANIKAGFENLSKDEMKNITCTEQGRSLKKKNLEMEYPVLLIKKGFTWMFDNFHWVIIGGCVALGIIAWWGISTGVLR